MTDQELAVALYTEGLRPSEIAEKLEVTTHQVKVWLGLAGGRPSCTNETVLSAIGDSKMTASQLAAASGIKQRNMAVYVARLMKRGILMRENYKIPTSNKTIWLYSKVKTLHQP